jgi:hypothetical protein
MQLHADDGRARDPGRLSLRLRERLRSTRANAALSELVHSGRHGRAEPGARVLGGVAARALAGRLRRS